MNRSLIICTFSIAVYSDTFFVVPHWIWQVLAPGEAEVVFLNYLALVILLLGLTAVFYTFIYIHDIPYEIAKHRNHPQKEAIHVAGWLSLFTLHAIWPIVFIWAVSRQAPEENAAAGDGPADPDLSRRLVAVENSLRELEKRINQSNTSGTK